MEYSHRYHAYPTQVVAVRLEHHLDVHRQLYNHIRWDYENSPENDKPSEFDQNNKLPEWKQRWPVFGELHSKAAQATVARFHRNLSNLRKKKEKGHKVGRLKRQAPSEYRSVTYNQSGFDLDEKRDHDKYAYVRFSKIGWGKIQYSRPIPDHAIIKELTTWLVREYDAVFVEDLDVSGMLQGDGNARNKQNVAWRQFISLLEYKADLYGTHVVQVEPEGTTKECASCGVETAKPIWVREHSCPSCGFETDRDANAVVRLRLTGSKIACDFATAMNVLKRGFSELGLGWPEETPVETVTVPRNAERFWCANESFALVNATDTTQFESVSASRVIETGSLPS